METVVGERNPDLVVSGCEFGDGCALEMLTKLCEEKPVPSIVVSEKAETEKIEKAMADHVMAYLVPPVTARDLRPAIQLVMKRFEEFQELHKENADLREAIETRKYVERAKGILMSTQDLSEEEAYLRLRKLATANRVHMRKVAEILIQNGGRTKTGSDGSDVSSHGPRTSV